MFDPLTRDYPWYTPYQFAGNTPIQAIDLDGLEPVQVIYNQHRMRSGQFPDKPALKLGQWYEVIYIGNVGYGYSPGPSTSIKFNDPYSYHVASQYNLNNGRMWAYSGPEYRGDFYDYAQGRNPVSGSFWFAAAADVSHTVYDATGINFWVVTDGDEDLLNYINCNLFEFNASAFKEFAQGQTPGWAVSLSGGEVDDQMVLIEQSHVGNLIEQYKAVFASENGEGWENRWDSMIKRISEASPLNTWEGKVARFFGMRPRNAIEYAFAAFRETYGAEDYMFDNLDHRLFIGRKMVEYYRVENGVE